MIDLKFLRENPEVVKQNIRNKFQDEKLPLVDEVIELDVKRRESQQKEDLQTDRCADGSGQKGRGRRGEAAGYQKCRTSG